MAEKLILRKKLIIAVVNGSSRAIGGNVATKDCVLELCLMTEPSEISSLGNLNNVKISDLPAFVVMLLFPLFVLT